MLSSCAFRLFALLLSVCLPYLLWVLNALHTLLTLQCWISIGILLILGSTVWFAKRWALDVLSDPLARYDTLPIGWCCIVVYWIRHLLITMEIVFFGALIFTANLTEIYMKFALVMVNILIVSGKCNVCVRYGLYVFFPLCLSQHDFSYWVFYRQVYCPLASSYLIWVCKDLLANRKWDIVWCIVCDAASAWWNTPSDVSWWSVATGILTIPSHICTVAIGVLNLPAQCAIVVGYFQTFWDCKTFWAKILNEWQVICEFDGDIYKMYVNASPVHHESVRSHLKFVVQTFWHLDKVRHTTPQCNYPSIQEEKSEDHTNTPGFYGGISPIIRENHFFADIPTEPKVVPMEPKVVPTKTKTEDTTTEPTDPLPGWYWWS